jgi:hypothetical protein
MQVYETEIVDWSPTPGMDTALPPPSFRFKPHLFERCGEGGTPGGAKRKVLLKFLSVLPKRRQGRLDVFNLRLIFRQAVALLLDHLSAGFAEKIGVGEFAP